MSQEEILEKLKQERIATAKELSELIGIGICAISKSLNRMLDYDVERIKIESKHTRNCYAWKIKGVKITKEEMEKLNEMP
jgi:predicted transcriptional regulator